MNLILAFPRSGSTTLMKLLAAAEPSRRWFNEPFSRLIYPERNGPAQKPGGLVAAMEALRASGISGIKHVWWNNGPFDDVWKSLELVPMCSSVVVLTRKNILRRVVSREMSVQSKQWICNQDARATHRQWSYRSVELGNVQREIEFQKTALGVAETSARDSGVPAMTVAYEDLFEAPWEEADAKFRLVAKLFWSPGGQPGPELPTQLRARFPFLLAENSKMNSEETYRLIPNIDQIEEQFGSEENGWLFR